MYFSYYNLLLPVPDVNNLLFKAFFIERPLKHADLVGFLISLIPNNKALRVLFSPLSYMEIRFSKKGPLKIILTACKESNVR